MKLKLEVMRKIFNIGLLVLAATMFTSCEKIKDIFDVEEDTMLEGWLNIEVDEAVMKTTNGYEFSEKVLVSPLDDEDIAEYEENIERIKATNVIATIKDVSKDDVVFEAGTKIIVKGTTELTWELKEPWPIVVGDEITLGDDVDLKLYKKITQMLSDFETLTIIAEGECNQTNVYVTLVVGIDVTFTANPL